MKNRPNAVRRWSVGFVCTALLCAAPVAKAGDLKLRDESLKSSGGVHTDRQRTDEGPPGNRQPVSLGG